MKQVRLIVAAFTFVFVGMLSGLSPAAANVCSPDGQTCRVGVAKPVPQSLIREAASECKRGYVLTNDGRCCKIAHDNDSCKRNCRACGGWRCEGYCNDKFPK